MATYRDLFAQREKIASIVKANKGSKPRVVLSGNLGRHRIDKTSQLPKASIEDSEKVFVVVNMGARASMNDLVQIQNKVSELLHDSVEVNSAGGLGTRLLKTAVAL